MPPLTTDEQIYGTPPADQAERFAQLEADRRIHNERTGGGEIVDGETQDDIDLHNEVTAGRNA